MLGLLLKAGLKAGTSRYAARGLLGYGIMQGTDYAADQLDTGVGPYSAGAGITTILRAAGTIVGGSMVGTAAVRGVGRLGMTAASAGLKSFSVNPVTVTGKHGRIMQSALLAPGYGKAGAAGLTSFFQGMHGRFQQLNKFSVGGTAAKLAFGGIGVGKLKTPTVRMFGKKVPGVANLIGRGAFSLAKGVAKSPFVLAADATGLGLRTYGGAASRTSRFLERTLRAAPGEAALGGETATRAGRFLHSMGNKSWGARMLGIGAVAGTFKLATEVRAQQYPPDLMNINVERLGQGFSTLVGAQQGRGMAFAGQQFYDPVSGNKPRRMGSGGAAGLVQSLHRLR